jgi:hypothetical protein
VLTEYRTHKAKAAAIAAGIPTFHRIPLGYRQRADRRLEPDPVTAPLVREVFERRAAGASYGQLRDFLRSHGIVRQIRGVQDLLTNRIYLGELRFGELVNVSSHEPLVDPALFKEVCAMRATRTSSTVLRERLLAHLDTLRCATCNRQMVLWHAVDTRGSHTRDRWAYRCPPGGDCKDRPHVSAELLEEAIVAYLKTVNVQGAVDVSDQLAAAEAAYHDAERRLANIVYVLTDHMDLDVAREKVDTARAARDGAFERLQSLRVAANARGATAQDWDRMTLHQQRSLIRGTLQVILVGPGRGLDRVRPIPFEV